MQYNYYQYSKKLNYPIYIRSKTDIFPQLSRYLSEIGFSEITSENDINNILSNIDNIPYARILTINEATPLIVKQIDEAYESDLYGSESILDYMNHKLYRFKKHAIMIYSSTAPEWKMSSLNIWEDEDKIMACRTIITRYLSWALAPFEVCGFWGVHVDDGIVAMKQNRSNGESIFIDLSKNSILSYDGIVSINPRFQIIRLDKNINGKSTKMGKEEFLSFLFTHCTYFDYLSPPIYIQKVIQKLITVADGVWHPKSNFRPRIDLSL